MGTKSIQMGATIGKIRPTQKQNRSTSSRSRTLPKAKEEDGWGWRGTLVEEKAAERGVDLRISSGKAVESSGVGNQAARDNAWCRRDGMQDLRSGRLSEVGGGAHGEEEHMVAARRRRWSW